MKVQFLIIFLLFISLSGFSQSKALKGNNQWLEHHLNSLVFKEGSENARFRFDDCDARMEVMAKGDNGFNMGMNFGCTLSQIEKVSYQKKGDAYQLNLQMKKEEENDNLSFSLSTTDEKLMQEIKKRLETSIAACKSTVN
jgi:hypothetical protein